MGVDRAMEGHAGIRLREDPCQLPLWRSPPPPPAAVRGALGAGRAHPGALLPGAATSSRGGRVEGPPLSLPQWGGR